MNAAIHLHRDDALTIQRIPTAHGTFLTLHWPGLTLYLPDYDATCAQIARRIAADLIGAAEGLEAAPAPEAV